MKGDVARYTTLSKYLAPWSEQRKAGVAARNGATAREIMLRLGSPQERVRQ
jgi:hypothetical protein